MRFRNCKVKVVDRSAKLAIGSMEEISDREGGETIILDNLYFLPILSNSRISVDNPEYQVMGVLLELCFRRAFMIRDYMGNVKDDFWGNCVVQHKAINFLQSEYCEDITNKVWYGVERILNNVFITMPYYTLKEIHYSVKTREVMFVGEWGCALNPYVQFVNHDEKLKEDTIIPTAMYVVGKEW
jgi:hypothetical protein